MSAPAATASGERSVAVAGDVHGVVVTGDNVRVVIRDGGRAGMLLDALGLRRVRTRPRRTPVTVPPPSFGDRVGREEEAEALRGESARLLSVVGEAHVGKTYVVSAAFAGDAAGLPAHGVVYVHGRGRPLRDLLQRLWEELYESRPPSVPSEAKLLRELADREVLVLVDSCELEHDEAQALAAALPRSRIVLVSRERRWWDGEELPVSGLREADALALLERELGAPITAAQDAAAVCEALGGHPLRIKQAAALVRRGDVGLEELAASLRVADPAGAVAAAAVSRASLREREVLAALAPFGGEPIGARLLEGLAGPRAADGAATLAERGVVVRGSPRYALALPREHAGAPDRLAAAETAAVASAPELGDEDLDEELPALVALLHRLAESGRHAHVIRLGRLLAPALVRARRVEGWRAAADAVLDAALAVGDVEAQGWALHEAGTHALAEGDAARGGDLLDRALRLRGEVGDDAGVRATRHNLRLLGGPPWYLRRVGQLPLLVLALALGLPLAAGGVGAAHLIARDGETPPSGSQPIPTDEGEGTERDPTETEGHDDTGETTPPAADAEVRVAPPSAGAGTVTSSDGRIRCPEVCAATYPLGATVELTANESERFVFVAWGHASCADAGAPCTLRGLDRTELVQARFEPAARLTVEVEDPPGAVTVEPPGATCGDRRCEYKLRRGSTVTLTAVDRENWRFLGWHAQGCEERENPCSVSVEEDAYVLAAFWPPVPLTVVIAGTGSVTSDPPGIVCSAGSCSASFPFDATVTLTAIPSGRDWVSWAGADCSGNTCAVHLRVRQSVTASFNPPIDP